MSHTANFVVSLGEPHRIEEALTIARRFISRVGMRHCTTVAEATLVGRLLHAHPVDLGIELAELLPLTLPPILLRGEARNVRLGVIGARGPWTVVHEHAGKTTFEVGGTSSDSSLSRELVEATVRARIDLARQLGALAPGWAFDPAMHREYHISIPVHPGSFARLATAPGLVDGCRSYTLEAIIGAAGAAELFDALPASDLIEYRLHTAVDDDAAIDALVAQSSIHDSFEIEWSESPTMIRARCHDGSMRDDGTIWAIRLACQPAGASLVIRTIIDHALLAEVEAWLSERTRAPVAYQHHAPTA